MKRECSPILQLNSRTPNHSFNPAPSASDSGGGGGPKFIKCSDKPQHNPTRAEVFRMDSLEGPF